METILSLLVGVGLSAACGFRVFVPLLIAGIAFRTGHLDFAQGFGWMGSDVALIAFGAATALEVAAYYIPWLDNFMDALATPAAVVAGTLITASLVSDLSPFLKWSLAAIAGGGAAAVVQAGTVTARGLSTAATGGLANPLLATAELGGSIAASFAALVVPVLGLLLLAVGVVVVWRLWRRRSLTAAPVAPGC